MSRDRSNSDPSGNKPLAPLAPKLGSAGQRVEILSFGTKSSSGYVGLSNQGATCYLNSLLQCLYMTPEFRHALFSWKYKPPPNTQLPFDYPSSSSSTTDDDDNNDDNTNTYDAPPIHSIPFQLQCLFARLKKSVRGSCSTKPLTKSFHWNDGQAFQQHDVQELLRVLFDAVSRALSRSGRHDLLNNLCKGILLDYLDCQICHSDRSRQDIFLDLSLGINNISSLEDAIANFINPEILTGGNSVNCYQCNKKQDFKKGLKFKKLPPLLFIQLNRFQFNWELNRRIKLSHLVKFPKELDMKQFMDDDILKNDVQNIDDLKYSLYGVIIQSGGALGGHYYAYIKSFDDNKWYVFNDSSVRALDEKVNEFEKSFGGDNSKATGYVLLYRQTNLKLPNDYTYFPDYLTNMIQKEDKEIKIKWEEWQKEMRSIHITVHYPSNKDKQNKTKIATNTTQNNDNDNDNSNDNNDKDKDNDENIDPNKSDDKNDKNDTNDNKIDDKKDVELYPTEIKLKLDVEEVTFTDLLKLVNDKLNIDNNIIPIENTRLRKYYPTYDFVAQAYDDDNIQNSKIEIAKWPKRGLSLILETKNDISQKFSFFNPGLILISLYIVTNANSAALVDRGFVQAATFKPQDLPPGDICKVIIDSKVPIGKIKTFIYDEISKANAVPPEWLTDCDDNKTKFDPSKLNIIRFDYNRCTIFCDEEKDLEHYHVQLGQMLYIEKMCDPPPIDADNVDDNKDDKKTDANIAADAVNTDKATATDKDQDKKSDKDQDNDDANKDNKTDKDQDKKNKYKLKDLPTLNPAYRRSPLALLYEEQRCKISVTFNDPLPVKTVQSRIEDILMTDTMKSRKKATADNTAKANQRLEFNNAVRFSNERCVGELKLEIAKKLGLSLDEFRLRKSSQGKEIRNMYKSLKSVGINNGSIVYVEYGVPTGPKEIRITFSLYDPDKLLTDPHKKKRTLAKKLFEYPFRKDIKISKMKLEVVKVINKLFPLYRDKYTFNQAIKVLKNEEKIQNELEIQQLKDATELSQQMDQNNDNNDNKDNKDDALKVIESKTDTQSVNDVSASDKDDTPVVKQSDKQNDIQSDKQNVNPDDKQNDKPIVTQNDQQKDKKIDKKKDDTAVTKKSAKSVKSVKIHNNLFDIEHIRLRKQWGAKVKEILYCDRTLGNQIVKKDDISLVVEKIKVPEHFTRHHLCFWLQKYKISSGKTWQGKVFKKYEFVINKNSKIIELKTLIATLLQTDYKSYSNKSIDNIIKNLSIAKGFASTPMKGANINRLQWVHRAALHQIGIDPDVYYYKLNKIDNDTSIKDQPDKTNVLNKDNKDMKSNDNATDGTKLDDKQLDKNDDAHANNTDNNSKNDVTDTYKDDKPQQLPQNDDKNNDKSDDNTTDKPDDKSKQIDKPDQNVALKTDKSVDKPDDDTPVQTQSNGKPDDNTTDKQDDKPVDDKSKQNDKPDQKDASQNSDISTITSYNNKTYSDEEILSVMRQALESENDSVIGLPPFHLRNGDFLVWTDITWKPTEKQQKEKIQIEKDKKNKNGKKKKKKRYFGSTAFKKKFAEPQQLVIKTYQDWLIDEAKRKEEEEKQKLLKEKLLKDKKDNKDNINDDDKLKEKKKLFNSFTTEDVNKTKKTKRRTSF